MAVLLQIQRDTWFQSYPPVAVREHNRLAATRLGDEPAKLALSFQNGNRVHAGTLGWRRSPGKRLPGSTPEWARIHTKPSPRKNARNAKVFLTADERGWTQLLFLPPLQKLCAVIVRPEHQSAPGKRERERGIYSASTCDVPVRPENPEAVRSAAGEAA